MQLDRLSHQFEKLLIAINQVGVAERLGLEQAVGRERAPELEPIDMRLPSASERIALEAAGDVLVRQIFGRACPRVRASVMNASVPNAWSP